MGHDTWYYPRHPKLAPYVVLSQDMWYYVLSHAIQSWTHMWYYPTLRDIIPCHPKLAPYMVLSHDKWYYPTPLLMFSLDTALSVSRDSFPHNRCRTCKVGCNSASHAANRNPFKWCCTCRTDQGFLWLLVC